MRYPKTHQARAVQMYETGSTLREIKAELNVSHGFVYYWLNHYTVHYHNMKNKGL